MANYYNRDDEWDSEGDRYLRSQNENRYLGTGYGGSSQREGWRSRADEEYYGTNPRRYAGSSGYYGRGYDRSSERLTSPQSPASYGGHGPSSRYYEGTNRPPYYGRDFEYEERYGRFDRTRGDERAWWDRASDEVASWFGDEEAERRRRYDELRSGRYRGRGPRDYRRSDERIREDINDRLTDHAYLDAYDVEVAVVDGEVALSGTVESRRDKRTAEDIAESVSGVKNVQNNLRVKSTIADSTNSSSSSTTAPSARAARQG